MMKPRPRVLFVGAFPPAGRAIFGGMVTSCRALLDSTFPARVDLQLLDSTQLSNPPPPLPMRMLLASVRFIRFIGTFERRKPDVVLLFVAIGASIVEKGAMAWYARVRGVPAILFPRAGAIVDVCQKSAFTRKWAACAFHGGRKLVCQSEAWRRFAVESLGFPERDIAVIRNWTATGALLAIGAQRSARPTTSVRLLYVGWLERDKGVFELLEACRNLSVSRSFTLELAGEGHASADARAFVARHELGHIVRFCGWLQAEDLERALRDADIFVLPSWAEGLPNAMVEAMAAGLAVVASRVGAIPEVIADRHSGLLVSPRDAVGLTDALRELMDDATLRERLAQAAFQIARRDFAVEAAVQRILEQIDAAVAGPRAACLRNDTP